MLATALGLSLGWEGLLLLGAPPEVLPGAWSYLAIVSGSFVLASLTFVGNAALRGAGDTRTPLLIMLLVNGINILFTWLLVGGHWGLPALGVAGSAWGAAIGRGVGGVVVLLLLLRGRSGLRLALMRLDSLMVRRLLRVGLPAAGEQLIFRFGMLTFNAMIASLGTVAYAAHTIGIQAESLSWLPGFGFGIAATTLVGQALGAGDPRQAQRSGYVAYAIGASFMSSLGILLVLFPAFFIGVFTDDADVIQAGTLPLQIMGLAQPVLASTMIFNGGLRGAGDTRWVLLANAGGVWVVRLPLTYALIHYAGWGLAGVWTAMAIDQAVRGSLAFLRFKSGRWKHISV
ncbi:MAG: hypothetical protein KatS3mg057_0950 [Herpetosiphonaceae bacterium]|nr:MAG: hypothetical protein KatS3mg057_0950 [Herpetosiphonaceae bacterium]